MSTFTYATAVALYESAGGTRQRFGIRVASNTRMYRHANGNFVILFYRTPIVVILPNGFMLNSGGRRTTALLHRLTRFTPAVIRVRGRDWFVVGERGTETPFFDEMVLDIRGNPFDEPERESAVPKPAVVIPIPQ